MIRPELKVGRLARLVFEAFLKNPDRAELARLQDGEYCHRTFRLPLTLPVLRREADILNAPPGDKVAEKGFLHRNYWTQSYMVDGTNYRIVNDWHERPNPVDNRTPLENWINSKVCRELLLSKTGHHALSILAENKKTWYRQIIVDDVKRLHSLLASNGDVGVDGTWVFRGQGDSKWKLETSLGRLVYKDKVQNGYGTALKAYERKSMWMFGRDASKDMEYRDFRGLNLLSLMQHYGCKTRLLDFSLSPLVAMFVAIDQYETNMACVSEYFKNHGTMEELDKYEKPLLALWAVNLNAICEIKPEEAWEDCVLHDFWLANKVVIHDMDSEDLGVKIVFPTICNRRISAQGGLFIMPTSLNCSFETNLCETLGMGEEHFPEQLLSNTLDIRSFLDKPIIKFIISPEKIDEIKKILSDANVTARTVYPDLTGLGKYVGSLLKT